MNGMPSIRLALEFWSSCFLSPYVSAFHQTRGWGGFLSFYPIHMTLSGYIGLSLTPSLLESEGGRRRRLLFWLAYAMGDKADIRSYRYSIILGGVLVVAGARDGGEFISF
ncbi:hypothetical protein N656DRAFT_480625 [Canariomyces notabilis]|jgi:hypothetical protein|uniref:Uncharacterized protein n=1 Tax=Canariomyces notabilis TaxID=2074819 RepID=A0AAN6TJ51_9PEZI|nr:hypothetical protein N656DRAFT_480625 [Canariomyces arenarius]